MQGVVELADLASPRGYPVTEFADAVRADLAGRGHLDVRLELGGLIVHVAGTVLLLDRLYRELQRGAPGERAGRIRAGLDAALRPPPPTWAEAQPLLRAVLRSASYTNAVTTDANRPWIRALWPFVHELAVLDIGEATFVVGQRDTAAWGVGGERMFAAARANIAARYPPQPQPQRVGHLLGDGRSYCDSAVLVPGWLNAFDPGEGPRSLVFFPGDEVLLVCTDDPAVAPAFFAAAEKLYRDAAVGISPQAYTVAGDRIVGLDAAGAGPARSLAVRARSVLAAAEYLEQAQRLGIGGTAVELVDTPRGVCTMTVWAEGQPWSLPQTDYVTLRPADLSVPITVPFAVLADIVGAVPDPEVLPVRWRMPGWPAPEVLAVLGAHAVMW
jgi:hypothetical protein